MKKGIYLHFADVFILWSEKTWRFFPPFVVSGRIGKLRREGAYIREGIITSYDEFRATGTTGAIPSLVCSFDRVTT